MEISISKDSIKEIVPEKYRNFAGIGPYYLPFFGRMYSNRLKKAMSLMPDDITEKAMPVIGDIGSGFGMFTAFLASSFPGSKIVGIDVYPIDILAVSRDISNKHNLQNTNFIRGNICDCPFTDEKFDILFALDVLEHVPDPLTALRECRRVLRKDGILIISVPLELRILQFIRRLWALVQPVDKVDTEPHWQGTVKSFQTFSEHLSLMFQIEKRIFFPNKCMPYDCFFMCRNHDIAEDKV